MNYSAKTLYSPAMMMALVIVASSAFLDSGNAQQSKNKESASDNVKKAKTAEAIKFLRLRMDENKKPVAMQTAITRYVSENGKKPITVDLVAVVHIGDKDFYERLNKKFKDYDVVLYELVAQEGTVIDKKSLQENSNPLRMLQSIPQKMLGLDSQLEIVDYKAKNFVHADLTPEEMAAKMAECGDSTLTLVLDSATEMIRQQNKAQQNAQSDMATDVTSLMGMLGDSKKMKLMMAKQFVESGDLDLGLGKSLNQLLIKDRNEAAMKDLNKQVFAGHRKLAIFYGAAHMPDFEKRLKEDYDFKFKEQKWLDAWDLTKSAKVDPNDPTQMLLNILKDFGGNQ